MHPSRKTTLRLTNASPIAIGAHKGLEPSSSRNISYIYHSRHTQNLYAIYPMLIPTLTAYSLVVIGHFRTTTKQTEISNWTHFTHRTLHTCIRWTSNWTCLFVIFCSKKTGLSKDRKVFGYNLWTTCVDTCFMDCF